MGVVDRPTKGAILGVVMRPLPKLLWDFLLCILLLSLVKISRSVKRKNVIIIDYCENKAVGGQLVTS